MAATAAPAAIERRLPTIMVAPQVDPSYVQKEGPVKRSDLIDG